MAGLDSELVEIFCELDLRDSDSGLDSELLEIFCDQTL